MTTTTSQDPPLRGYPRLLEIVVLLAPMLMGLVVTFLLPPLPEPSRYWGGLLVQSGFALAPLAVALSGRLSWGSIGLRRDGLRRSLALGALLALVVVGLELAFVWLGLLPFRSLIGTASRFLGLPLAVALYLPFWGVLEAVWMAYLIHAANRWLTGGGVLSWRALFLAALFFGLIHVFIQIVLFGAPLPQALLAVLTGLVLLIPGTVPKLTGNAWGLVLFWVIGNY